MTGAMTPGSPQSREAKTNMTEKDAHARAATMGLSAWVTQAIAVGPKSRNIDLFCVGFAALGLPLAEAETWEEAFHLLSQIIE